MAQKKPPKHRQHRADSLETEGPVVLAELRESLGQLMSHVDAGAVRPVEVAAALGLDRKIAWKISHVIHGGGPDSAVRYVPGPAGVRLILRAGSERGVPARVLKRFERASKDFRALMRRHGADRAALDVLLTEVDAAAAVGVSGEIDLATRRSAFTAGSAIWGVRAETQFRVEVLRASRSNPEMLDAATIRGMVGIQRMRLGLSWTLFRGGWADDVPGNQTSKLGPSRRAVDVDAFRSARVPLLSAYCDPNLPKVVRRPAPGPMGSVLADDVLEPGPVGRAGACTVVTADAVDAVAPRFRSTTNLLGQVATLIRTPARHACIDIYVERGVLDLGHASAEVCGDVEGGFSASPRDYARLPCTVRRTSLRAPAIPGFAGSKSLVPDVIERLGWGDVQFEAARFELRFPIVHSVVLVSFQLPQRP